MLIPFDLERSNNYIMVTCGGHIPRLTLMWDSHAIIPWDPDCIRWRHSCNMPSSHANGIPAFKDSLGLASYAYTVWPMVMKICTVTDWGGICFRELHMPLIPKSRASAVPNFFGTPTFTYTASTRRTKFGIVTREVTYALWSLSLQTKDRHYYSKFWGPLHMSTQSKDVWWSKGVSGKGFTGSAMIMGLRGSVSGRNICSTNADTWYSCIG